MEEVVMRVDVEQARKLAKERVKSGQARRLAEAQRDIARELGYASWPDFVGALGRLPAGAECAFCEQPISGHDWVRLGIGVPSHFAHRDCVLAVTNRPPLAAIGVAADDPEVDKLTPRARRLWLGAATIAREFGHSFVGTEHLLLAMVREADGIAGKVLGELGGRQQFDARLTELLKSETYNGPHKKGHARRPRD
jgi:hypothetical protein